MSSNNIKTRLCIISDTHTTIPFPDSDTSHIYRQPFPKCDVLLHCGDITNVGYLTEFEAIFNFLQQAPAELKLVIAGNHDITLHKDLYLERLKDKHRNIPDDVDAIRELWTGEEARRAGIVYLEEGVKTFTLGNGARFTVRPSYSPWKECMKWDCVTAFEAINALLLNTCKKASSVLDNEYARIRLEAFTLDLVLSYMRVIPHDLSV